MQIVFSDSGRLEEREVVVHDRDATVGDLVEALAPGRPGLLLEADGVVVGSERRLDAAGIRAGSVVRLVPIGGERPRPSRRDGDDGRGLDVAIVGGLDAGGRSRIGSGRWMIGRATPTLALDHDTVSAHHATLAVDDRGRVEIGDAGSRNGTWVDGRAVTSRPGAVAPDQVVRVGAVQIAVRPAPDDDRPAALGGPAHRGATVPFNRPPRPAAPPPSEPLAAPDPVPAARGTSPVGVMSVVGPLLCGGLLVAVTGQTSFALLVLLSPVMAVGAALDARRRRRRGRRRDEARFRRQLDELDAALSRRAEEERAHRADLVPDPAEVLRRVEAPSTRLWERRPRHHDWLLLHAGIGATPWNPPVEGNDRDRPTAVADAVRAAARLVDAPVVLDLAHDVVLGIVGPRPAALAVARSLVVQAAVHHGPADLAALVLTGPDRTVAWDWAKWLPHLAAADGSGRRRIVVDPDDAEDACRALLEAAEARRRDGRPGADGDGPTTLLVVDDEALVEGRTPVRAVLRGRGGPVAGIVVAASDDRLPASCTTVLHLVDGDGTARLHHLGQGAVVDGLLACGVSEATARRAARGLARFADPEATVEGATLPAVVPLLGLLGLDRPTPEAVATRWAAAGPDPAPAAPLGLTDDGPLVVDLARDGPHGLVAGTTGAGKSELLRSLVAGLAAGSSPDHCTFVLVDFKGGSAFAGCARLPHTVGLATDLDAHLAERALRCLHAELRHRERVLAAVGARDLTGYRRAAPEPLPRLVVVVDEFATLKAELPDFVDSLLAVAQRGRSLGVHLVLATQRPSGSVGEDIRANTDLRIALRVQDARDSVDVVDTDAAALIPRHRPGRALARLGPGELVLVQTALSTGAPTSVRGPVEIRPFHAVGPAAAARAGGGLDERPDDPTDLARLVDACVAAHAASGRPLPRRPWPDPLPADVDLDGLGGFDGFDERAGLDDEVLLGLADRPDDQVQVPIGWRPADGGLLLVGLPGSGTTTALLTLALSAGRTSGPDALHLYAVDAGAGGLAALAGLPHTGAVVPLADRERQARLFDHLRNEIDRRRSSGGDAATAGPRIVVLVDGVGALRAEWDEAPGPVLDAFARVFAEGAEVGVHVAVAADRPGALPATLRSLVRQQLLFALGDETEYLAAGLRGRDLPTFVPGRAVDVARRVEVQIARPRVGLAAAVEAVRARWGPPTRPPMSIAALPERVSFAEVAGAVALDAVPRVVPLGIGGSTLGPVGLVLHPGEHALVAGPARSGRTTALAVAAGAARRGGWRTVVVAGPRSGLGGRCDLGPVVAPDAVGTDLRAALDRDGPVLLLVDDAEGVDPDSRVLPQVLGRPDVVVVAAGRAEALRGLYAHWTRTVRQSRVGLLLRPDVDLDGDLLGVRLPRRPTIPLGVGRGYLCEGGSCDVVQVASPPAFEEP